LFLSQYEATINNTGYIDYLIRKDDPRLPEIYRYINKYVGSFSKSIAFPEYGGFSAFDTGMRFVCNTPGGIKRFQNAKLVPKIKPTGNYTIVKYALSAYINSIEYNLTRIQPWGIIEYAIDRYDPHLIDLFFFIRHNIGEISLGWQDYSANYFDYFVGSLSSYYFALQCQKENCVAKFGEAGLIP
jgi:hypothetical protein